ncbi:DUF4232 domain-containing protein [Yinghuangia soli]|uniref:DUF4232 domain-containing protein n=1 Tax=Yinghuangia soli TaxID=2908204 RepID=A0AA41U489_9ACTN|nr:DUF4232 domain-containing protein [Yinghuangia soli]MCF2532635.1 DUF4232 domain-containing protein [Yinghuangia soli]
MVITVVATTVALAGGGDGGEGDVAVPPTEGIEAPVTPAPPTGTPGQTVVPPETPKTTAPSGKSSEGAAEPGTSASTNSGAVAACTADKLAVTAAKEPADATEMRHLLITAKNTGSTPCKLYNYPHVVLVNARSAAPVIEESNATPGEPVTLAPGKEAFAAMVLNGPMDEYKVTAIKLTLSGTKAGSKAGSPIDVPMPVSEMYANDFQRVTYWTTAPGFALDFVMSK